MGGTLGCKSEVGKGSTFFFSVLIGVPAGDGGSGDSGPRDDAGRSTEEAEHTDDDQLRSSLTWQWNLAGKKGRDNKQVNDSLRKQQKK